MAQMLATSSPCVPRMNVRLPVEKFAPSLWGDTFTSFSFDTQVQERYCEEIESLKTEVKKMLVRRNNTQKDTLILIDTVERLGVAYHLKQEIEEQLQHIFNFHSHANNDDLVTSALQFRLLRQHRHHVSSGKYIYFSRVFEKFKGKDGKFDKVHSTDGRGLLNLYEAAHVKIHGEHILEAGLAFATHHLNLMTPRLECPLGDQVKRALQHPLQKASSRIETCHYISFYERDNLHNEVLLRLAKLDFNYVQNLNKKELHDISKWWYNFDLFSKLTYARDRVVECYFWANAMVSEPQDSFLRVSVTKCLLVTSILDDTFDNYATVEEAETFTQALQRWDINEIERLPDYMKVVYKFILSTYKELQSVASERGRSFAAPYVREAIKQIGRGYNEELKWLMGIQVPTFEAYEFNSIITSAIFVPSMGAYLGMESASKQVYDWLLSWPKLVLASARVSRHRDDVCTNHREGRDGHMLTGFTMYMKLHGLTKEKALEKCNEMIEEAWMDINAECFNLPASNVPHDVADLLVNFARTVELYYTHGVDAYTHPENLVTEIAGLLVNPLTI